MHIPQCFQEFYGTADGILQPFMHLLGSRGIGVERRQSAAVHMGLPDSFFCAKRVVGRFFLVSRENPVDFIGYHADIFNRRRTQCRQKKSALIFAQDAFALHPRQEQC